MVVDRDVSVANAHVMMSTSGTRQILQCFAFLLLAPGRIERVSMHNASVVSHEGSTIRVNRVVRFLSMQSI